MRVNNRAQAEIDNLTKEIEAARSKYQEAISNNEPEAVKQSIERIIQYLTRQLNQLQEPRVE